MNTTGVEVYLDADELEEVKALCLFYGVSSYMGLVAAQAKHIERLQEKLASLDYRKFYPSRAREG